MVVSTCVEFPCYSLLSGKKLFLTHLSMLVIGLKDVAKGQQTPRGKEEEICPIMHRLISVFTGLWPAEI